MILFVNACVRRESRTKRLADNLLKQMEEEIAECRADRLYYVTTAGGTFVPDDFGFGYVKALSQGFYGIRDVRLIKATGLDIYGADTEEIMRNAIESIDA